MKTEPKMKLVHLVSIICLISFTSCARLTRKPKDQSQIDFQSLPIIQYIIHNETLYKSFVETISSKPLLNLYVISFKNGTKVVDFNGLLNDQNSYQTVLVFLHQNVPVPDSMKAKLISPRLSFNDVFGSFMNSLNVFSQTIQANLQNSVQTLVTTTINDIFRRIQESIFQQKPIKIEELISLFLDNLKQSITQAISTTVQDTFKQQALAILDLQFKEINKLLESLKNNSIAPVQFINLLQNQLSVLQTRLVEFLPTLTELITSQLLKLLSQLVQIKPF